MGIVGVADAGKRELGVPPHEFSVVELGVKRDCTAGVFWNVQTIVNSVRRARRNQADINEGACGPSISFVDEIAVSVNLERPIEVRALLNRAFSSVFNPAAPEDSLVFIISGLQLEPDVEGGDGAGWEKMADLLCADDHIVDHIVAAANCRVHPTGWRRHGAPLAGTTTGR